MTLVETISLETFKKVDIRVGEIMRAQKVVNADKLLQLNVLFGEEERQIVSGIAQYFPEPEALVGKRCAFVYNLEPRTIRGIESQGMILASAEDSHLFLIESQAPSGTKIG